MKRCEKCGKLALNKDSNLKDRDDLDLCECGGKLVYVQDFTGHIFDEMDPFDEIVFSSEFNILNEDIDTKSDEKKASKEKKQKDKKKKS